MKYCEACGQPLPDHAAFCEHCGTPQQMRQSFYRPEPAATEQVNEDVRCLNQMRKMLRAEHLAWKIAAIINTCAFGLLTLSLLSLLTMGFPFSDFIEAITEAIMDSDTGFSFSISLVPSLGSLSATVPGIIIGFIQAARVRRCYENIYTDPVPAIVHCSSVGSIILGALCNEVALIFIIINFVHCRKNKNTLDQILLRGTIY